VSHSADAAAAAASSWLLSFLKVNYRAVKSFSLLGYTIATLTLVTALLGWGWG
jgi:hypothetical protein